MLDFERMVFPEDAEVHQAIEIISLFDTGRRTPTHNELDTFDAMRASIAKKYNEEEYPSIAFLLREIGRVCLFATMENMGIHEKINSEKR